MVIRSFVRGRETYSYTLVEYDLKKEGLEQI